MNAVSVLWVCFVSFAFSVWADDGWDREETYRGYTESSSDKSWSPDIRDNTTDSQSWHALNRWQGRVDKEEPPLTPDLDRE